MFPLQIFPEHSLAESVITTVWVGVFVIAFFNLRLGWPFSGLVVPGYLVPLMIAKPIAAGVVVVEGVLTYLSIWLLCSKFNGSGMWSAFFGRDRFFALIIASLVVRLVFDGLVFPVAGEFINEQLKINFDYRNNLSSFGLIIVALIANQFWKTGVVRGQIPFWTTIGVSFLIVRYVLMELTNFNIGNLEYMYESISVSLVASPKAYIVLLTCAFVASRMNLLYGWDFNGILIPSLLALEWYNPSTIFFTFVEAYIILGISVLALKTPLFRSMTVEGARKLLLFFNVSYAYKLVIGHTQNWFDLQVDPADLFGYGYLVPTLIAVKMHDKHIPIRLTRATLQTSLTGAVFAGVLGFALTLIPTPTPTAFANGVEVTTSAEEDSDATIEDVIRGDKVSLYELRREQGFSVPLPHELDSFFLALRRIERYSTTKDPASLKQASQALANAGYELRMIQGRYAYMRERGEVRGWGIYVVDTERRDGPVVEVPAPVDEWAVLEAGTFLFRAFNARALAIAGCSKKIARDGTSDVLKSGRTLYTLFHRVMAGSGVAQVRGYDDETVAKLGESFGEEVSEEESKSLVLVRGRIPEGVKLRALRDAIGGFSVKWGRTPFKNLQRDESKSGFCEFVLTREDRKQLLSNSVLFGARKNQTPVVWSEGYLQELLLESANQIAGKGSEAYVVPKREELLLFDDEILTPLVEIWRTAIRDGELNEDSRRTLEIVAAYAGVFGYRVEILRDHASDDDFIVLRESLSESRRYWGTYVFRLADSPPYVVQVPRPHLEKNSYEFGVSMFARLPGQMALFAGAHPWANSDLSSDLTRELNRQSLFSLVNQVVARETASEEALTVQCRAFGFRGNQDVATEDVLVSLGDGCTQTDCFSPLVDQMYGQLASDDIDLRVVGGGRETAGYEVHAALHAQYGELYEAKQFCALWLSPFFRSSYMQQSADSLESSQFLTAEIPTRNVDLFEYLDSLDAAEVDSDCDELLIEGVRRFVETRDVVALVKIAQTESLWRLERVIDSNSRKSFLLAYIAEGQMPFVFRLSTRRSEEVIAVEKADLDRALVERFKRSGAVRLEISKR